MDLLNSMTAQSIFSLTVSCLDIYTKHIYVEYMIDNHSFFVFFWLKKCWYNKLKHSAIGPKGRKVVGDDVINAVRLSESCK